MRSVFSPVRSAPAPGSSPCPSREGPTGDVATAAYYETHGTAYAESSRTIGMRDAHARFLPHVPPGGCILDAGCGSGRDAAAFSAAGFRVVASDLSATLLRAARAEAPGTALVRASHLAVPFRPSSFDGIWASATFLHLPRARQTDVLASYAALLTASGVLYVSYKLGTQDGADPAGRWFTYMTPESLCATVRACGRLTIRSHGASPDAGRPDTTWLWCVAARRP